MNAIPADWPTIFALAASGVPISEIAKTTGIKIDTLKSRIRRNGVDKLKGSVADAKQEIAERKEAVAIQSGRMSPVATNGREIVAGAFNELGKSTRLSLAIAAQKAAETAEGMSGLEVLESARNLREVTSIASTVHGWGGTENEFQVNIYTNPAAEDARVIDATIIENAPARPALGN